MKNSRLRAKSGFRTLAAATAILLSVRAMEAETRVSVNRHSFNPSLGENVAISVRPPAASRISIAVLDRDGYVTRWLAQNEPANDTYTVSWNGRDAHDALVADEAYSFKVDVTSAAGHWTYFPAASVPKTYPVQAKHYSRRNAALMYELPAAARIHAQAGSAAINAKTKTYNGPVLKTLVNRDPRPAGAIVESWNGLDESGAIYIPDLPQFVTAILATDLPENAVIAFGNPTRTFLDVAAKRSGVSLLPPSRTGSHAHHHGLNVLEDVSPSLMVAPAGGTWDQLRKSWTVKGVKARLSVQLAGPTAHLVARQPGRILVFIDYKFAFERRVRHPMEIVEVPLTEDGTSVVSINWQSEYGPLAANSVLVSRNNNRATSETQNAAK